VIRMHLVNASTPSRRARVAGFSMVEMLAVIGVVALLLGVAVSLLQGSGAEAVRSGRDQLAGMVEQGRTAAITRRAPVMLAVLEPGRDGADAEDVRLGLFELDGVPGGEPVAGRLMERWRVLPGGVACFGGEVESWPNAKDAEPVELEWGERSARVWGLVFNPRGGLAHPQGSGPVVIAIGQGAYIDGVARNTDGTRPSALRVGRVVARPWHLDT